MYLGFGYLGFYHNCGSQVLHSKLDEWGYFILTIASETQYLCMVAKKHLAEEAALLSVSTQGQLCECTVPAHALAAEHVLTATRLVAVKSPLISWWSLTTFSKWAAFIAATSCTGTTEPSVSPQELFP